MVSVKNLVAVLSSALAVSASPVFHNSSDAGKQISTRQASEIPPNSLYLAEWYPNGCGNGNGVSLTGHESTLAVCSKFMGLSDPNAPSSASVRFLFPDDGRTFKWRLFSTNDCATQIYMGEGDGCFTVPSNQKVGAIIVYT
ncbi:hypothetical protein CkaCkLH20_11845 [Colletotrichum karsti]|uniref:Uncharacterized protein n=1 Tax=Colletotrichum karsti TaxID=1095194 RepID=A0A9P6HTG7_9PEZI|nr:uncharacterized protein CkaCkLH20_11845 [Colletotrichum karsti]KAF9870743.1 hypothetical protein CkaCkLH20_11845 [Colletotrichum karsti]